MSSKDRFRIKIDVPAEDHKRLYSSSSPNKKTLKVIENIEKGNHLTKAKNREDLFRKLDI